MILDVEAFVAAERPYWDELDRHLQAMEDDPYRKLGLDDTARIFYLYQRASSDLARAGKFSGDPESRQFLQSLVGRAHAELHETRSGVRHGSFRVYLLQTFPQTFRKHFGAFLLTVLITLFGIGFGAGALHFDPPSKAVLMPFSQLQESPAQRVKREETAKHDRVGPVRGTFSAQLMTHNIQVALFTLALGTTWGIGSIAVLFYNGVTLGAVAMDYIQAGFVPFLFGWLLPHGVIEIPAILVAGQASFVLAGALIGWGDHRPRRTRLRLMSSDLLALAVGAACMLVWAGLVEAFLSQYHEPTIPYAAKIAFGAIEAVLLVCFLALAGRK